MPGATDTTNSPDVAPEGIVMVMDVLLHELMITGVAFRITSLPPCVAPKLEPVITTSLPTVPLEAETLVVTGAGAAAELTETLLKVTADKEFVLPLVATKPTKAFCPMSMV
jgi:hypothetical protein